MNQGEQTGVIISTAVVGLLTGYVFGIWTIRGYLISPSLVEERRRTLHDPVESDESEIDEDDTVLDHAPNWANGADADRKQGLRALEEKKEPVVKDNGEECKLVLVVRTDLGMTKGMLCSDSSIFWPIANYSCLQAKSRLSAPTLPSHATRTSSAPPPTLHRPKFSSDGSVSARPRSLCKSRVRARFSSFSARHGLLVSRPR
jgi:PTH2 family peptidyl-tRNA hydrolase